MTTTAWWQQPTAAISTIHQDQARARQLQLTKPPGSLGQLEEVAIQVAALTGQEKPTIKHPQLVVFAGDHGVVAQGVSAFPQAVTVAMLSNFVAGGAAVAVLAKAQGIGLSVVNCGTATPCDHLPGVIHKAVMPGTNDFSLTAAMNTEQAQNVLKIGADMVDALQEKGCDCFMAGEMGIGNTSAASCLSALLLNKDVQDLVGPGTGVHGDALNHKAQVLAASVARARPLVQTPLNALEQCGGLELGAMAGAFIRAAQLGIPVLIDGFIATASALLAIKLNAGVRDWLLFGHRSAEPGHSALLSELNAQPLVQLGMRLGEGSGAAVAYGIVQQALTLHNQMATFAEAAINT